MKFQSIQVLRGLAALLVVFYHAQGMQVHTQIASGPGQTTSFSGIWANGYAGVDLFFAISGFVVVWVTRNWPGGPSGMGEFLFARIARIYPLWWVAALLATAHYAFSHADAQQWRAQLQAGETGEYLLKSFLLIPQDDYPVLSLGWTLVHEMYFYAVFALVLLVRQLGLTLLLSIWAGIIVVLAVFDFGQHQGFSYTALAAHPLTLEFILGAFAALLVSSGREYRPGLLATVASLWLLAALCLMPEPDQNLKWIRVAVFGLPSVVLVYAFACLDRQARAIPLIPAAAAFLMGALAYQMTGAGPGDSHEVRRIAAAVAIGSGLIAALGSALTLGLLLRFLRAPEAGVPARMVNTALGHTGDWSYSIYLGHLFVIGTVQALFAWLATFDSIAPAFRAGHPGSLDDVVYYSAILTGTLVAGWGGYTFIERPALAISARARQALFGVSTRAPRFAAEPR